MPASIVMTRNASLGGHQTPVGYLEPWLPGLQMDLRSPQRPDQHQPLLSPAQALAPGEPEQPAGCHLGTRFLPDLTHQCVGPALLRLGTAARQAPTAGRRC
jgi:hypothetical protein